MITHDDVTNGAWWQQPLSRKQWSNYTICVNYDNFEFHSFLNDLYVKGYTLSLVALLLSLCIFLTFRSLRCARVRIHINLFASLACSCILSIYWYKSVIERPDVIYDNPSWCIGLHLLLHYIKLVNYFWILCECWNLQLMVMIVLADYTIIMRRFLLLAWGLPVLIVGVYAGARYLLPNDGGLCWMPQSQLTWILSLPVCLSLLASSVFLINVLRVIMHQLYPNRSEAFPLSLHKMVRVNIILVPLFGLQHLLSLNCTQALSRFARIYKVSSVCLISSQGFLAAMLYCFLNQEVLYSIHGTLHRLLYRFRDPTHSINGASRRLYIARTTRV